MAQLWIFALLKLPGLSRQRKCGFTCCVGDMETVGPPWLAEPDLDVLSDRMQHAFNHPDEARRRGQAACEHIRGNFTWDHAAHCVEARLQALRAKPVVRFTDEAARKSANQIPESPGSWWCSAPWQRGGET